MNSQAWSKLLPPLALLLALALIWQLAVVVFAIPPVLLPTPLQIALCFWANAGKLFSAALITASAAIAGLVASTLVGTLVAMGFSQSVVARRSCYPYAIFLQTVPIVAIAPLIVIWLGEGFLAIATIAFTISLFPIITNATDGLLNIGADLRELFQMYGASRWQTLYWLQLPHALPQILTGVKIASATAVLGAIVGEFFAGAGANRPGLGYLIFSANGQFRLDFLFAAIVVCTALGVAIFYSVSIIGQRLLYWVETDQSVF